ncbi:DUF4279 domain-containing protein [Metasolibacillus meyeri]|uniref:DUF4279 domain-containing protein n=1 Tax=Metasolibacillus meyeri TaxID=1071052 RepID=A0AAW9NUH9_9BACL|nr:DUF4279 domain-containing protein [Metasolibacillus meyeri]MEC1178756.1 DUF4279 domain-containing protein [Metasolibacillus meyeri]
MIIHSQCRFALYREEDWPLNALTERIGIVPLDSYRAKVDGVWKKAENIWGIRETIKIETGVTINNPTEAVDRVLVQLLPKLDIIKEFQNRYQLTGGLDIFILFEDEQGAPGIRIDKHILQFIYELDLELDISMTDILGDYEKSLAYSEEQLD